MSEHIKNDEATVEINTQTLTIVNGVNEEQLAELLKERRKKNIVALKPLTLDLKKYDPAMDYTMVFKPALGNNDISYLLEQSSDLEQKQEDATKVSNVVVPKISENYRFLLAFVQVACVRPVMPLDFWWGMFEEFQEFAMDIGMIFKQLFKGIPTTTDEAKNGFAAGANLSTQLASIASAELSENVAFFSSPTTPEAIDPNTSTQE